MIGYKRVIDLGMGKKRVQETTSGTHERISVRQKGGNG